MSSVGNVDRMTESGGRERERVWCVSTTSESNDVVKSKKFIVGSVQEVCDQSERVSRER